MSKAEKINEVLKDLPNTPVFLAGIDTGFRYSNPPHIRLIENALLKIYKGESKRLIINMPPRHGKTHLVCRYFPAWYLINKPDTQIIYAAHSGEFAANDVGMVVRNLIQEYGNLNPDPIEIDPSSKAKDRFNILNHEGIYRAVGVDGPLTGRGANLLIIDDPIKNDEAALSKTQRDKIWNWYQATAYSRLEPNGAIIIIMTRWHKDDLVGRIIDNSDEDWEILNLPAIAEYDDIVGRERGQALWEERFPLVELESKKNEIGSFWFSALYQQNPIASEFQIFKPENWIRFNNDPKGSVIQCWDTAQKEGQLNDFSVCTTWRLSETGYYLINCWRGKPLYPDLREKVIQLHKNFKSDVILIEDASSGQSLIPDLKRYTRLPIRAVEPSNKVTRAHLVSPLFENKRVFIKNEPWAEEVILEMADFPQGQHDDIVDSITHALEYMKKLIPERRLNGDNGNGHPKKPVIQKAEYFTNY